MEFDRRLKVGQWSTCMGTDGVGKSMLLENIGASYIEIVGRNGVFELHKWSRFNDCRHFSFQIFERERTTPAYSGEYSDKIIERVNGFVKAYTMGLLDV